MLDFKQVIKGQYKIKLLGRMIRDFFKYPAHKKIFFLLKPDDLTYDIFCRIKKFSCQFIRNDNGVFVGKHPAGAAFQ